MECSTNRLPLCIRMVAMSKFRREKTWLKRNKQNTPETYERPSEAILCLEPWAI